MGKEVRSTTSPAEAADPAEAVRGMEKANTETMERQTKLPPKDRPRPPINLNVISTPPN
jgi:hypothetical protein